MWELILKIEIMNFSTESFEIDLSEIIKNYKKTLHRQENKVLVMSIIAKVLCETGKTNLNKSISETIIEESDKLLKYLEIID